MSEAKSPSRFGQRQWKQWKDFLRFSSGLLYFYFCCFWVLNLEKYIIKCVQTWDSESLKDFESELVLLVFAVVSVLCFLCWWGLKFLRERELWDLDENSIILKTLIKIIYLFPFFIGGYCCGRVGLVLHFSISTDMTPFFWFSNT